MRMRPSLRPAFITHPLPFCRSDCGPGEAGLASPARLIPPRNRHRTAAGPGQFAYFRRNQRGDLGLAAVEHRGDPLDMLFAELARAVALVQGFEDAPLARRAVDDVRVARERTDRDARAAG